MSKKQAFTLFIIILILLATWWLFNFRSQNKLNNQNESNDKLAIVTTLFPLYDIAKNIGGEAVNVSLLLDPGLEAHSFEPTPSDMIKINQADIFIYTGKFMETWAEDIINSLNNPDLLVIDASTGASFITASHAHDHEEGEAHTEDEADHEEDDHDNDLNSGVDPHIWLDFDNLQIITNNIAKGIIEKMPEQKDLFSERTNNYLHAIQELDADYKTSLANCEKDSLIYSGHYAFAYLTNRYNLNYESAYGLSPNSEPSAQTLVGLVKQIQQAQVKYIFHEELMSPRVVDILKQETGADVLTLNTAHNLSREQLDNNRSLFSVLTENLEHLKTGLECY